MIHAYGDSWTYGSDLNFEEERPYVAHMGEKLGVPFSNRGKPGNSNVAIYHNFMEDLTHEKIKENDMVVFCFTETSRFTIWDELMADSTYCKYTPVLHSDTSPKWHKDLFKWTFDIDQGHYDLFTSMISLHNICKQCKIRYVFGFAFGEDYLQRTSFRSDIQKLVDYVNSLKMNRADKRFSSFVENYQYGEHSDHAGHIKYAKYLLENIG